ncbi:hypothetical protein JIR001_09070 [Polycladomyces abyssicola]|uniref:Uncharacterized protein n=1 Tax=Polycladomyces abyssicola TaxID=1125966 RepID=A0A8D5UDN6_9BACL|nr:hypothetical protein JIR001_09070 [Polycladomyces abyssicola]
MTRGMVRLAEEKLFSQHAAVDFAKEWLERQRQKDKTFGNGNAPLLKRGIPR